MKFSPYSIKNQEFNKTVRGYDKEEVRAFLEKLSDEVESLQAENESLNKKVEELNQQIKEFRRIEKNLQNTLLNATESSTKAVESAKKQTALLIKEAELKSTQIVEKAKEEADYIRESVLKLREEKRLLLAKLKSMIETQAQLLEMDIIPIPIEEKEDEKLAVKESIELPVTKIKEEKTDLDIDNIVEKLL